MNGYVLTWSASLDRGAGTIKRQAILDVLDKIPEVENWRTSTGAIFISSSHTAAEISAKIHRALPNLLHVLALIDIHLAAGWTDRETWDFIRNPKAA